MANNFNFDQSCVAVYNFEDGFLTTDSSSGGVPNTLTAINSPTADLIYYKQGTSSTKLVKASRQCYHIADVDLSSDFPLKNTGQEAGTWVGWIRHNTINFWGNRFLYKVQSNGSYYGIESGDSIFSIRWGQYLYSTDIPVTINTWYHVAFTFDGSTNSIATRIFRDSDGQVFTHSTSGAGFGQYYDPALSSFLPGEGFYIGGTPNDNVDGYIDEVVVFNRVLSNDEIDEIRNSTYVRDYTIPVEREVTQVSSIVEWVDPSQLEVVQVSDHVEWAITSYLEMPQFCIQVETTNIHTKRKVYQELVQLEYQNPAGIHVEQSLVQLEHLKYRVKPISGLWSTFERDRVKR
jgi:hypothetical protein